jgi:argininosuccinate lyase
VSRGDLLSTVLRLDTAETLRRMRSAALDLGFELLRQCERNREVILPGFTHGQASQPILWSHFCLAYVEMVLRDVARLRGALERTLVLPLGSGALAGTSFPVDRERLAQRLGFREASDNSVDAVGDRDFVVETLAAASLLGQHAARLAQELLHLGSPAVGFLRLGEAGCTQADLLPQQRNATALELARVRASNLLGNQFQVQMLLRPLAGAYHRDLEEMAEPLRRSESDAVLCLRTLTGQLTDLELRPDACRQGTTTEFTTATDLANYLIGKGMPARTATATAREVVQRCRASGKDLHSLPLQEYQLICPLFEADLYEAVSADSSIGSRLVRGGTSPMVVAVALKRAEKRLLKAQAEL